MIIGVTGQIGAGKSSAAEIMAELGAVVIDADRIGKQVVDDSSALRRKLARAFGSEIIDSRGYLRRKKLAELAFRDTVSRDRLNRLVHPYLLKELRRQVRTAGRGKTIVIDAALLLHWKMDHEVDFVLVIHAGRDLRLKRLQRRGIDHDDTLARMRAQLPYREFQKRSDRVILNNRSRSVLRRKVRALYRKLAPQTD